MSDISRFRHSAIVILLVGTVIPAAGQSAIADPASLGMRGTLTPFTAHAADVAEPRLPVSGPPAANARSFRPAGAGVPRRSPHAPMPEARGQVTRSEDPGALVIEAVANSDRLRGAMHETAAARARTLKAWSGYVPLITGSIWAGRDPNAAPRLSDPGKTMTLSASMPLLDGGQIINSGRSAERSARASATDWRATRDQIAIETLTAAIEFDLARRQQGALRRSVEALLALREAVRSRIAAGYASDAELAEVDADVADARNTLAGAEAMQARAEAQLAGLVGRRVAADYRLPDFSKIVRDGLEPLLSQAKAHNPTIEASWHRAEAARYSSYAAIGRYLPRLDMRVEHKTVSNYRSSSSGEGWTVGLALKVPLVDAGTLADVAEARENAGAARFRALDKGREIATQIEIEWRTYQTTKRQAGILERKVRALELALAARRAQFDSGLTSLDEVLAMGRRVLAARVEVIEASARSQASAVSLAARAGRIEALVPGL